MAHKITLKNPIEAHGKTITELNIKEPTLGVLEEVNIEVNGEGSVKLSCGAMIPVVAALTDIPPSSARELSFADLAQIGAPIMDFLGNFQRTGES